MGIKLKHTKRRYAIKVTKNLPNLSEQVYMGITIRLVLLNKHMRKTRNTQLVSPSKTRYSTFECQW